MNYRELRELGDTWEVECPVRFGSDGPRRVAAFEGERFAVVCVRKGAIRRWLWRVKRRRGG